MFSESPISRGSLAGVDLSGRCAVGFDGWGRKGAFDPTLLYAAKDKNTILRSSLLAWSNPDFRSTAYSITLTCTRFATNAYSYNGLAAIQYYAAQSDCFAVGLQTDSAGSTVVQGVYRLNNFNILFTKAIPVGTSTKFVFICSSSGIVWTSNTTSYSQALAPPQDNRMTGYINYAENVELTEVSFWKRALTATEKTQYFDGQFPIFNGLG